MFLYKLRFLAILTALLALAPVESFNVQAEPPDRHSPVVIPVQFPVQTLPVQTKNVKNLGPGKLLVASRDLADPNFVQTVILLVHYDAKGVVGLVLNRRSDVPLSRAFKELKSAKDRSDPVYLGGPVDHPAVFALLQSTAKPEGAERVFGGTYLIATKPLFEQTIAARPDPGSFHVYLGYAGWAKEQLQIEVALGAWFIFPADVQTVFSSDPDSLWQQMIRKTEMTVARREPGTQKSGTSGLR